MKKFLLLLPLIFLLIITFKGKDISNYFYFKYVKNKIEKKGKEYLENLKNLKKNIYDISENLKEPSIPSWSKLEDISKKYKFNGFILIKDLDGKPIRWYGNVKEFNFEKGFRAVFTIEGPFLIFSSEYQYGNVIISSPVPEIKKYIYLKNVNFFPPEYFFPLPDTLKPPTYSFLYKEEGPPLLLVNFEAISNEEFQKIFFNSLKSIIGVYLVFLLFFIKINFFLKLILFRLFFNLISFEIFPIFEKITKKEIFHFPFLFLNNPLELAITSAFLFLAVLKIERRINNKISVILFFTTSVFYLILIKNILNYTNLVDIPFILKISIFLISSSLIYFWIKNLEFLNLRYFLIFFVPLFIFFPLKYSLIFLILGTYGSLSFKLKKFLFFSLLAIWALIPPYIFQRENLKIYIEDSYSFSKINQTTFSVIRVKSSFLEILKNWDWQEEFPSIDLIENKKELGKIIEEKLSLNELPIDYKLELFEGNEKISIIQNKNFPVCSLNEVEGLYQEEESLYHLSSKLFYKGKEWGNIILHIYFYPPYLNKKELLPIAFGIYDKEGNLQNSNSLYTPEKLDKIFLKQSMYYLYQEGDKFYLFLIPPWEFYFPYLIFSILILIGSLSSITFPINFKSIYFLILIPLLLILFLIIFLGFLFTSEQRKSLINLQTLWGSSIQKNVLNYANKENSTFYYDDGILKKGEIIEEKFNYCPSKIMKKTPLKKPEVFEIDGEYYLFFEGSEGQLIAFKQTNLQGMEKPIQWLTEKTWGNIIFFYSFFLIFLISLLTKILSPIRKLSQMAKEVERGKDFYDLKPIFGKEIEDLSFALKESFLKLQEEEKTLKETLKNLPVGVALFKGEKMVLLNELMSLDIEEILKLKEEGIFEKNERIYQYKKVNIDEEKWIFFLNDITTEIEKEKLSLISNIARIVAHEIKNPLTPIKLSIEYLNEIFKKKKNEFELEFPKISKEVLESLRDLEAISSEFSDFTRLPDLKKERVNLNKILKEWLSPFVSAGKIVLNLAEEEIFLNLDIRLFKRALLNIINNAWQSAKPEPVVYINLKKEENIILEVVDSGPGVPEEILPKIFDAYFTTKTSGTGLGLFIAKKIIEEHKGKIFAENTKDKGLKIKIIFS